MKEGYSLFLIILFLIPNSTDQDVKVIDPPFWWTNMPVTELQIQLYGDELGQYRASVNYDGVEIKRQIAVDSPNYLFLYLDISAKAKAGKMEIILSRGKETIKVPYQLLERESLDGRNLGFDASDVIYLMMPDRFANGNPDNDSVDGMLEKANREDPTKRQGGDIQGVRDHLDYIQEIGMTAIWFTPIIENDMKPEYGAYHGYAATDLYKVDRRYGSNKEYKALIDEVHNRGMKVIMDMIHNHIGDQHWWMKDLPTEDWVHDIKKYGTTSFRGSVASDPYASKYDYEKLTNGWFVPQMPDLNQKNELLSDYLIQNTLWWIEYSGIDGIRMDTYVYPDKNFMAKWAKEVLEAYPNLNIVGEAWVNTIQMSAFWQYDGDGKSDGYDSNLPSVTDFPFANTVRSAFNEDFGWTQGLRSLYYLFAQDAVYEDPMLNVIFLDNHDMGRIFETVGKNEQHFKMAYAFLMTARGIPQVYYGTELMLAHENRGGDDEGWRQTLPGTWSDDERSIFKKEGRTETENRIFEYVKDLTQWRKSSIAIHEGKFLHFVPENNVYVYFRIHEDETIMIVMNMNQEDVVLERNRFAEILDHFTSGDNILNSKVINVSENFSVGAKQTTIWELKK
jgi:glycosidase